jgi:hypothetical protein
MTYRRFLFWHVRHGRKVVDVLSLRSESADDIARDALHSLKQALGVPKSERFDRTGWICQGGHER